MTTLMNNLVLLVTLTSSAFTFSSAHIQSESLFETPSLYEREAGYIDDEFLSVRSLVDDLERREAELYDVDDLFARSEFTSELFRRVTGSKKAPPPVPAKPAKLQAPTAKQNPGVSPTAPKSNAAPKSNTPAASSSGGKQTKITDFMKPEKPKDKITDYFKPTGKTAGGKPSTAAPAKQPQSHTPDAHAASKPGQKTGEGSKQASGSGASSSLHRSDSASSLHGVQLHDNPVPAASSGLKRTNAIKAPSGQGRSALQKTNSASSIEGMKVGGADHKMSGALPAKEGGPKLTKSNTMESKSPEPKPASAEKKPGALQKMKSGVSNMFKSQDRKDYEKLYPNANAELHALPKDQQKKVSEDFRLHNGVTPDQFQYEQWKNQRADGWISRNDKTNAKASGEKTQWDNNVKVPVFAGQMVSAAMAPFPKLPIRRRALEARSVHYNKRALIQRELYLRMVEEDIWG